MFVAFIAFISTTMNNSRVQFLKNVYLASKLYQCAILKSI